MDIELESSGFSDGISDFRDLGLEAFQRDRVQL